MRTIPTVSYTHLDVYKRQLVFRTATGFLLLVFLVVVLLLNIGTLFHTDWKSASLLHEGSLHLTVTPYMIGSVMVAGAVSVAAAFLYRYFLPDKVKQLSHRQKLARMILENGWYESCLLYTSKCINCGACQAKCPFGAIEDMSWMLDVIELLKKKEEVYAVFAPAIQGQFDSATLPQIMQAMRELGFSDVYEAAIGADAVAWYEKEDAKKHKAEGKKITTSCCPAFVNMAKQHFPTVYESSVSHMVSPMVATTRYLKKHHPNCKVVFVGPCVAKKQEVQDSEVDFCITFEELGAMFVSRHISPENVPAKEEDTASAYGRFFSVGGGVSKAVAVALKENNDEAVTAEYADGSDACKKALLMMQVNRFQADILEGMACQGGCICGPATIENMPKAKARMTKENLAIKDKTIASTLEKYDFSDIDLHR